MRLVSDEGQEIDVTSRRIFLELARSDVIRKMLSLWRHNAARCGSSRSIDTAGFSVGFVRVVALLSMLPVTDRCH